MAIVISEVILATRLVHNATKEELIYEYLDKYSDEEDLWVYDKKNKIDVYKKDVQLVFDRCYNYFYVLIINTKTNE